MSTTETIKTKEIEATPGRILPYNDEAEKQLLGAIFINNESYHKVSDFLLPEHFFLQPHQEIYEKIGKLIQMGKVASPITLQPFYSSDDQIADIPAVQYLVDIAKNPTTLINVRDYGHTIYELSLRRGLINIGEEMVDLAYESPIDNTPAAQVEEAEKKLYQLMESGSNLKGFISLPSAVAMTIEMADAAFKREGKLTGISTGLVDIDLKMGGLQQSDLIVIAARPGMGKTALATNIAYNVASHYRTEKQEDGSLKTVEGGIVGFFSLEMSAEQLATRIVSEQTETPSSDIRRGGIDQGQFDKIVEFSKLSEEIPLYVEETGGISIGALVSRARRLKRQKGLDLIVVDYIQLLTAAKYQGNRVQEIAEITTGLKALAKELNVPIIAISQLSRQVESRENKRPQLADLRESGAIEQDADVVLFIYREAYYIEQDKPDESSEEFADWFEKFKKVENLADVIIAKQRHGPTGKIEMAFHGAYTRFSCFANSNILPE